jgi:hypothetical protein
VKETNLDTEMQNTLTLEGFENHGLIAASTPTKGARASCLWTAHAVRKYWKIIK